MLGGYRDSSGGGRASGGTTGFGQPAIPAFAIGAVERLIGSSRGYRVEQNFCSNSKLAIPFSEAMSLDRRQRSGLHSLHRWYPR